MKKYEVGEYLVHENSGVCQVAEITEKALQGRGSEKLYYSLEPVFSKGTMILTPVDTKVRIRDVMAPEEFEKLLDRVPELPIIDEENTRTRTEIFKEEMAKFDVDALASVLKTVYLRKELRIAQGKKVMASDEKVMAVATRKLYEEMAFSMDLSMEEVERRFIEKIEPDIEGIKESVQ